MKKKVTFFTLISIITFLLLSVINLNNTYSPFNSSNVLDNVYVLSSDALAGRLAGSNENLLASEIIKNRFKSNGLKPLTDSYLQNFQTICPVNTGTSPYLKIESNGELDEELQYGVDFKEDMINFKNNTFRFSKDDKITTYLSYMEITCSDGQFLLYVPKDDNFSFRSSFFSDFVKDAVIMVSSNAYTKISEGLNAGKEISIHIPFASEEKTISNVVGVIKGSNSALSPLVITAHYDHLGQDALGNNYSGALDNASGTSFILELSRSLSTYGTPKRDIIFVALNAEEFGLLGSKAFAETNLFSIKDSQVINFDMIGSADYPISFVQGSKFKATDSDLLNSLKEICDSDAISYEVEYEDSSDHASFNNVNIDAVSFCHSDKTRIHTPNDTLDYIDASSINTVYNVVNSKIQSYCYSGLTQFVYSPKSMIALFIVLCLLILWGIFDKSHIITDISGSRFFSLIAIIACIASIVLYFNGTTEAMIVIVPFALTIPIVFSKKKRLS